ncbi:uncharacterized protein METZ01_LOCUS139762 [marine metagenome]|jgi:hypothetical protein|uniref:Uncharacterized protein n=1 Tax=marine metagenome TaxID=408172 RepID=A0A381ZC84_9ZZZZ
MMKMPVAAKGRLFINLNEAVSILIGSEGVDSAISANSDDI